MTGHTEATLALGRPYVVGDRHAIVVWPRSALWQLKTNNSSRARQWCSDHWGALDPCVSTTYRI